MLKKLLARLGKGAATVDLRFENRSYYPGDVVEGKVHISGGEVDQKVNFLAARLMLTVQTKKRAKVLELENIPLMGTFVIHQKEEKVVPFTFQVPANLPATRGSISYYFDTELDIDGGVDRMDADYLTIEVPKPVEAIFNALEKLGYNESSKSGKMDKYGQEFSFHPIDDNQINEIELRFAIEKSGVRVWLEIDSRHGSKEIEARRIILLDYSTLQNESKLLKELKDYITKTIKNHHQYTQPSSKTYKSAYGGQVGSIIGTSSSSTYSNTFSEFLDDIDDLEDDNDRDDDDYDDNDHDDYDYSDSGDSGDSSSDD